MGLFSKGLDFSGVNSRVQNELTFNPAEGVAAIMLAAVSADGHLSDEECKVASTAVIQMQLFRSYSADVVGKIFRNLDSIFTRYELKDVLVAAKESIPYELKPTVFAIATDVILADGIVTSEEENMLEVLCRLLEVPGEQAQQIVNVMVIKNRG